MLNINPVMPQTAGNLKSSKSNHPAFTSKLSLGEGAYDAVVKTFNEAKPYKKTNLFKGIIKFIKGAGAVYKDFGMDGLKAYKNECFGTVPNSKALVSIVSKRFEDVTRNLDGVTELSGVTRGSSHQLESVFKKDGNIFCNNIGTDMPHSLIPMYAKKSVVDHCVKNLVENTARAISVKKGNEFDSVKYLMELNRL